jgi:hypothetical protein
MDLTTTTALAANLLGALAAIATIGGIAYKRPDSALAWLGDVTGTELYLSREAAIEAASPEEVAEHVTDPELALERIEALGGVGPSKADHERVAALVEYSSVLHDRADEVIDPTGPVYATEHRVVIDRDEVRAADRDEQTEHLAEIAEALKLPETAWCVDPLETITRLEDDPETAYVWNLGENATANEVASLRRSFEERFAETHNREPRALHLIVAGLEALQRIPDDVIENTIKPWLRDREAKREAREELAERRELGAKGRPAGGER